MDFVSDKRSMDFDILLYESVNDNWKVRKYSIIPTLNETSALNDPQMTLNSKCQMHPIYVLLESQYVLHNQPFSISGRFVTIAHNDSEMTLNNARSSYYMCN